MYNEKTGQVLRTESQDGENNDSHAETWSCLKRQRH